MVALDKRKSSSQQQQVYRLDKAICDLRLHHTLPCHWHALSTKLRTSCAHMFSGTLYQGGCSVQNLALRTRTRIHVPCLGMDALFASRIGTFMFLLFNRNRHESYYLPPLLVHSDELSVRRNRIHGLGFWGHYLV